MNLNKMPESQEEVKITYAESQIEDAEGVFHVHKETWLDTYPNEAAGITKDDIEKYFLNKDDRLMRLKDQIKNPMGNKGWVAKINGEIAGFVSARNLQDEKRIKSLYVLPEFQGKHVGTGLMKLALSWLGSGEVHVAVADYNEKAIKFYEKFGFEVVEKSPDKAELPGGKFISEVEMVKR